MPQLTKSVTELKRRGTELKGEKGRASKSGRLTNNRYICSPMATDGPMAYLSSLFTND
jgi:hypothetical protein